MYYLILDLTWVRAFSFKPLRKRDGASRAIFHQKNTRGLKEKRKKISRQFCFASRQKLVAIR